MLFRSGRLFNSPLKTTDRSSKQKINKEIQALNHLLDQLDLINIYRIFHPKIVGLTFFSSARGTFFRTDHNLKETHVPQCSLQTLGRGVGGQKGNQPQFRQPASSFSAGPPWKTRPKCRFLFRVGGGGSLRAPAPRAVPALQSRVFSTSGVSVYPSSSGSHRYEVAFPDVCLGPKYEPTPLHGRMAGVGQ